MPRKSQKVLWARSVVCVPSLWPWLVPCACAMTYCSLKENPCVVHSRSVSVGCSCLGAFVSFTEYRACTSCPCPPYIALYGARENISKIAGVEVCDGMQPMSMIVVRVHSTLVFLSFLASQANSTHELFVKDLRSEPAFAFFSSGACMSLRKRIKDLE